jgi:iron complex transport system permease protein
MTKDNRISSLLLSGLLGGSILCVADILSRSVAQSELPVSVFTSLLGAPFLIWLLLRKGEEHV